MWFFRMEGGGFKCLVVEVAGGVRCVYLCVCDGSVFCIHFLGCLVWHVLCSYLEYYCGMVVRLI